MVDCGQGPEADSSCPGCWTCPARTQSLFLGETGLRLQTAFDFILGMYDNIALSITLARYKHSNIMLHISAYNKMLELPATMYQTHICINE